MCVEIMPAYDHPREIRALFSEYTAMLAQADPSVKAYLEIQHYANELQDLESKYGHPDGRLYLAWANGKPAGCIGLRKLDDTKCEMKRLYVRPEFRGNQIGERLIQKEIADAKEIGYSHMLLDTLPFLQSAIRLYRRFGFYEIPKYNDSPMDTTIYLQLDL